MNCCQCQGIEELFSPAFVSRELAEYHRKGPIKTTRMLIDAVKQHGVAGLSLLDIGGGLGAVQHALLEAGAEHATDVDASSAYIAVARVEAQRRGQVERVDYLHGDFVALADRVQPADIVTLDRVICCYNNMEKLVSLSAERAQKIYGVVYPRDTWWVRIGLALENILYKIRRSPFRSFVHPTPAVEEILHRQGFKRSFYRRTFVWQVVVFTR